MKKFVVFLSVMTLISACARRADGPEGLSSYRQSRLHLGTIVHLTVIAEKKDDARLDEAFRRVWSRLDDIYAIMTQEGERSDVAKINRAYPHPVRVDDATYAVIAAAGRLSDLTRGAFDITVYPLIKLWGYWQQEGIGPRHEEILAVQEHIGNRFLRLIPPDKVQRLDPQTGIGLGGIAKGYAVDEAARIFRDEGFDNFYIEAGGDIYCGGVNADGRPWRIGIRHPRQPRRIIDVLLLSDMAVTTSGDYERFYFIHQQRWSHIINPITGYPQRGIVSATVIAPRAMTADALSTALCVLPPRVGLPIIDRLGQGYAALVMQESDKGSFIPKTSARYEEFKD